MKSSASVLLDKALALLRAAVADQGDHPLAEVAAEVGLPRATAYRLAASLVDAGFLTRVGGGVYVPSLGLRSLFAGVDERSVMAKVAKPVLQRLAARTGLLAQMGVFEAGMVTYLVKVGSPGAAPFTREGMQLEAYCSGLGKVLLAHLPAEALEAYLAGGPFIRLTGKTIVDPAALSDHLSGVRADGFALDDREVADDLKCVATPVWDRRGVVRAAVSLSARAESLGPRALSRAKAALREAAHGIEARLYGPPGPNQCLPYQPSTARSDEIDRQEG